MLSPRLLSRPLPALLAPALALALTLALAACGRPSPGSGAAVPVRNGYASSGEVSAQQPMVVDPASRTVKVYALVNGKYFHQPTRHGMNFTGGKYGTEAIFATPASQLDFYDALMALGAVPGNNLTGADTRGQPVQGQPLTVQVTWDGAGREYDINEVVVDSTGRDIAYRFGGNVERSQTALTGCFICLDSCPVGIASNSSHAQGSFDGGVVEFRGNADVLPPDGSPVTVIVQVREG